MAKLNFYDTDAVKAFVLNILVENTELKESLEFERRSSTSWFNSYQEAEKKVKELEEKVKALEGGSKNE